MWIPLWERQTWAGAITFFTPPIDVSEAAALVLRGTVHAIGGTTPQMDVTPQTSDNGDDWEDLDTSLAFTMGSTDTASFTAVADQYGRLFRAKVQIQGTAPVVNSSCYLYTHASS